VNAGERSADDFDCLVLGGGWRGLAAALARRRATSSARLLVVEQAPHPGGNLRTQRTNGYVCELGSFAWSTTEIAAMVSLLARPPQPIGALPSAVRGQVFDGDNLVAVELDEPPLAFATGNEEIIQAARRELDGCLRLGRAAAAVARDGEQFVITLGGEAPTTLRCRELVLALPTAVAGQLLSPFDPHLRDVAGRIIQEPRAFTFFGGEATDAPEFAGYGILPSEGVESPLLEVVHCSQVFPHRALPGRFLSRCELVAESSDDAVLATAERELRRWTGTRAPFALRKLHRFEQERHDGALVETKTRLLDLHRRLPGLQLA
jgi:protoporphyrinogen oxidase